MKKKVSKKQNVESADAQNRCIWMTAGVISFKLCPFNYDCEHCDLDKAMRSQAKSKKKGAKIKRRKPEISAPSEIGLMSKMSAEQPLPFFTFSPGAVMQGLYLHPNHLWARQVEHQRWKVGVDQLLAYILPPPARLELYDLDKDLIQEQMFGKILTQAGAVFLSSPLSGRLLQANPRLAQHPELVQQDPYEEGWVALVDWTQDRSELEKFYTGNKAKRFLDEEAQHLKFLLKHRGVGVDQIGETLPDGGADIKYLHQVLPAKVCLRLALELVVTGKQAW